MEDVSALSASRIGPDDNTGSSESQDSQGETGRVPSAPSPDSHPWHLPLDQFVAYAIRETAGTGGEGMEWKTELWEFTRLLRGWVKEGTKADAMFSAADKVVRKHGGWWDVFSLEDEEAYTEFCLTWKKIRWRPDESPLQNALKKADAYPVKAPHQEKRSRPTPGYDRFISFAGWLQVTMGDRPIYLPVREVAKMLKTDIRMVSMWRQMAIDDGFLVVSQEHNFAARKATEFRVAEGYVEWFEKRLKNLL